jgi:hypothetical protein
MDRADAAGGIHTRLYSCGPVITAAAPAAIAAPAAVPDTHQQRFPSAVIERNGACVRKSPREDARRHPAGVQPAPPLAGEDDTIEPWLGQGLRHVAVLERSGGGTRPNPQSTMRMA